MAEKPENLLLADYGQLKWEYEKAYAEIDSLKLYLDDTLSDLNQAERAVNRERSKRKIAMDAFIEYSQKAQATIAGVSGWLDAARDYIGGIQWREFGFCILEAWIEKRANDVPIQTADEDYMPSSWSDIPF